MWDYSPRTEKTYKDWIKRYILFHNRRHPKDMGAEEIQAFITHLAIERHVAASTQNQALSAIIFLYRHVLQIDIALPSDVFRAEKSETLPVVLTHPEAMSVINKMIGVPQLMAKILYGSGGTGETPPHYRTKSGAMHLIRERSRSTQRCERLFGL